MKHLILGRRFAGDAFAILALVAVLAYALLGASAPTVRVFEADLTPDTIWEDWTVTVPQLPGCQWADVDLELVIVGEIGVENDTPVPNLKPFGWVYSRERVEVSAAGQLLHREPYALWLLSDRVAPWFDGAEDCDGPSGTRNIGSTLSYGAPTLVDAALFDGTGSVELEIIAPTTETGSGGITPWLFLDHEVVVGGRIIVRMGT